MAPIPDRPSEHPSADELFRQMIETLARGRVAAQRREEAKEKAQSRANLPTPIANDYKYRIDEFAAAAERVREAEAIADAIQAQMEEESAAIHRHYAARRRHIRAMAKAKEILGEERFNAARGEARRRRGK